MNAPSGGSEPGSRMLPGCQRSHGNAANSGWRARNAPGARLSTVTAGTAVTLTATANDTRYNSNGYGTEPVQSIAAARYSVDKPSWAAGATLSPMSATDGTFNATSEGVRAVVDTGGWTPGQHMILVESQDAAGNWGVPSAVFVTIQ